MALPAHQTKHLACLAYPFLNHTFQLQQSNDGHTNGSALWLGAQCLLAFLADALPAPPTAPTTDRLSMNMRRKKAIELGSGIGLTALGLASLGWDVLATDTAPVISAVLQPNIAHNAPLLRHPFHLSFAPAHINSPSPRACTIPQVRELDWTVEPASWTWQDPTYIASHHSTHRNDNKTGSAEPEPDALLDPGFDLIITSDTVYSSSLIVPLLRTLHHLCVLSQQSESEPEAESDLNLTGSSGSPECPEYVLVASRKRKNPLVYLALENRDPDLISSFLEQAKSVWGFSMTRVPHRRVSRSMDRCGLKWKTDDWSGVEIWKMQLDLKAKENRIES